MCLSLCAAHYILAVFHFRNNETFHTASFTQANTAGAMACWIIKKDPQFWPLSSERKHIMTLLRLMGCSAEPRKKELIAQKKDGSSV